MTTDPSNPAPPLSPATASGSGVRWSRLGAGLGEPVIDGLMRDALRNPELLSMAAGFTDNSLLPERAVREATAALLSEGAGTPGILQYGTNQGRPRLREALANFLNRSPGERAAAFDPDRILIANGSQQILYLSIQALCDPGDIVLVESPSYFVFLELLKGLEVTPRSLPMTPDGGIDLPATEALLDEFRQSGQWHRVKLLYLVGWFANPSSRCIPEEEKRGLGRILQRLDWTLPLIEDAAYRELYFEAPWPAASIMSLPEFDGLPSLYAGTFTKPFASGLKVGYAACSDSAWLATLLRFKGHQDFGTTNFNQAIVEHALIGGAFEEHLQTVRPVYQAKMEALDRALREAGLEEAGWQWSRPCGGLLMWLIGPEGMDTRIGSPFCQACLDHGVLYVPGDLCIAEGEPTNAVRLAIGTLPVTTLREAARRFARAAIEHAPNPAIGRG